MFIIQIRTSLRGLFMNKTLGLIVLAGFVCFGNIKAQQEKTGQAMMLFQSDEILNLRLEADFKTVFSVKDDSTYFPAEFTLTDNAGFTRKMDVKIRTRGKTRRENDVCRFTPLRVQFPKKETANTPFEGQRAIKLVTHCNKPDFNEQNTIIEYLIYRAFNILTDSSFRVRPAIIDYIYTDKKADSIRKFAFFIEREKHLAERLHAVEFEEKKINPFRLNPFHTCLMDMFQYMIGNTDYSTYELHNIILISDSSRSLPPVAVPYDFDWSGLISAVYAVPHPLIHTEKVTERVYRGFKKQPEVILYAIHQFKTRKQEIYQLFENFEMLDGDRKKQIISYLDEFYDIINNDRLIKMEFIDRARVLHN